MKRFHWLIPALLALGCLTPNENVIFDHEGSVSVAGGGAVSAGGMSSNGAQAGTDSSLPLGGTMAGGGGSVGGSGGSGGLDPEVDGGAGGQTPRPPVIESCDSVPGSSIGSHNGHCYRVNESELTFAAARDACQQAAGHLVTISSEAENDFARDLHDGEHWLGASDGRGDTMAGVGTYTWVDGEPLDFTDWEDGQPNAFKTDCPDEDGGGSNCYEHCAFQTDEGDWNDRSCWHTIVSICEWDVEGPGVSGAAGALPGPH